MRAILGALTFFPVGTLRRMMDIAAAEETARLETE